MRTEDFSLLTKTRRTMDRKGGTARPAPDDTADDSQSTLEEGGSPVTS